MFSCGICHCSFSRKQGYDYHINSKKHIMRSNENTSKNMFTCTQCKKIFTLSSGLSKHKKICKGKDDHYEQIVVHQQQQIDELKQQINYLLETSTSTPVQTTTTVPSQVAIPVQSQTINNNQNTINSHNKNTTNNNININIHSFGNENLDYLNDSTIEGCINRVYDSIPHLIKTIHFHPKHPENHNIKVTNKKLPHATYLDEDKQWKLMNKNDAIHTMVENGYSILESKFKEDPSKFTEERRRHYRRFQENYDNEDKETMKRIKNDVELVLYNGTKDLMKK